MAYYFNWSRGDIFSMTGQERKTWLEQVDRIHKEQQSQRYQEVFTQAQQIASARQREENVL